MYSAKVAIASTALSLWAFSAGAVTVTPTDAMGQVGHTAKAALGTCSRAGHRCLNVSRAEPASCHCERDYDRCAGPELLPQPCQQFALGVLTSLGDHRTVQMQQGAISGTFRVCGLENHAGDLFERVIGDDARRVRVGRDRMNEGPAVFVRGLEGSAESGASAAKRLRDLVFEMEIAALDQRHVGFDRLKVLVSCIKRAVRT